jgi:hypothetical protein
VKSVDGLERATGWRPMGLKFKSCWNTVSIGFRKSVTKWTVVIVDVKEHVGEEVVHPTVGVREQQLSLLRLRRRAAASADADMFDTLHLESAIPFASYIPSLQMYIPAAVRSVHTLPSLPHLSRFALRRHSIPITSTIAYVPSHRS